VNLCLTKIEELAKRTAEEELIFDGYFKIDNRLDHRNLLCHSDIPFEFGSMGAFAAVR
jgi:hypothetical protein